MFKKPLAHQSNATPIRSSARRQLLSSIYAQYPVLQRNVLSESGGEGEGEGMSEKELGRLLLPEGVRSCSFDTSAGVEGTMYLGNDGEALWVTFGRKSTEMVPTLYTLSANLPHPPLPILQLPHPLPPPLLTGAPLFLPAVRNLHKPHLIPDVPQNGLVAFVYSPTGTGVRYVGVGRVVAEGGVRGAWERRAKHLQEGVDRDEGKFCEVLCIVDDHLWQSGPKPTLRDFELKPPEHSLAPPPTNGLSVQSDSPPDSQTTEEVVGAVEDLRLDSSEASKTASAALSPSDVSTLLHVSLLQALSTLDTSLLPLPASQLYSGHILPSRPAYIPLEQRDDVVIAKSEWKKLAKWMKEVSKDGLIRIKESKGEVQVLAVHAEHPALDGHKPHVTLAEEERKAQKKAAREATGPSVGDVATLDIRELWRPSGPTLPFWEACGVDTKDHPPSLIKETVDGYITKNNLVDPHEHRLVRLDDLLGKACGIKRVEPSEKLQRDEVLRRVRGAATWSVAVNGVLKKGALSPIMLSVRTRQARKTVTVITGLEAFGVPLDEFAEELRKSCAGSTTVQPLTGASPKLNLSELIVQGPQIKVVTDALVARGVPKRWIKEDTAKKK